MASISQEPRATPSLPKSSVVVASMSEIEIKASAEKTFAIVLDNQNYREWNTWCPRFEFPDGQKFEVGSTPTMLFKMDKTDYNVPVKIIELTAVGGKHRLAWRSQLLPAWAATIERVQEIEALPGGSCRLRNWECMGGFAAYIMKWFMGIQAQLDRSNAQYAEELKGMAERTA